MKAISLKQGTRAWESAKETRIGSSEIFDIVRYYATDNELHNCGLNAEAVKEEKPFTTAWALYHKIIGDGIYQKGILPPELGEYGHAVEPYGASILQEGRTFKLQRGKVFIDNRLIASLDIYGTSEDIDIRPFDYGEGSVPGGKKFVCEQKTVMPNVLKKGLPIKYVIQAQYQITMSKADFFILQLMVLKNDTVYERGKIAQMSTQGMKKLRSYLKDKMSVTHIYFNNNERLAMLIKTCLKRFFKDVDNRCEPTAFLPYDTQKNILESLRINSFYNDKMELDYDLSGYVQAKADADRAESSRLAALQAIIDTAKEKNASRFVSDNGYRASFSANGAFLVRPPKEA